MTGDELLTERDVAALTTLSRQQLAAWRKRGEGPAWVRLSAGRVAYPRSAVEKWLTECTSERT